MAHAKGDARRFSLGETRTGHRVCMCAANYGADGSLTFSIGIEGHARQRFQNEPIMRPRCMGQWDSSDTRSRCVRATGPFLPATATTTRTTTATATTTIRCRRQARRPAEENAAPRRRLDAYGTQSHSSSLSFSYFSSSSTSTLSPPLPFSPFLRGSVRERRSGSGSGSGSGFAPSVSQALCAGVNVRAYRVCNVRDG